MTLAPGSQIDGRYEVRGMLGSGTYGEVYEVYDHHQNIEVALKLLDPTQVGAWPWEEPTLLTHLASRHILKVWNAGVDAGYPFIVTEVATNGTWADNYSPGITPRRAVQAIRDAARGTQRAHDGNVLHRDIKLENLFIADDDRTVLGDFGLAHPLDTTGTAPAAGTLTTLAPEVLADFGETSIASDIYSLGASLYALLTGFYPFLDLISDPAHLSHLIGTATPTPVRDLAPHLSQALGSRVDTALARSPADRYNSAADLDAALGALPVLPREWTPVPPPPLATAAWVGVRKGRANVEITLSPAGRRVSVDVRLQPSGRRSTPHCKTVPASAAARAARVAIADLS